MKPYNDIQRYNIRGYNLERFAVFMFKSSNYSPPRGKRWRKNVEKEITNIIHSFIKKERDLWKKDS